MTSMENAGRRLVFYYLREKKFLLSGVVHCPKAPECYQRKVQSRFKGTLRELKN